MSLTGLYSDLSYEIRKVHWKYIGGLKSTQIIARLINFSGQTPNMTLQEAKPIRILNRIIGK